MTLGGRRRGAGAPSSEADGGRRPLPFSSPTLEDDEIEAVAGVLRSGWITTGPRVAEFEALFRERLGAPHAIALNSATAGLHLAVASLDLEPGDEVIVPSLTWAATANAVELCGGRPVFADVERDTLNLDPDDVKRRLGPRTRAIIPVHFAGQPADLAALRALAAERGIPLIEDAAHALGASHRGVEIGASGDVVVFSFHPIKNVTTGEGGMLICRDQQRAQRIRLLSFHGVSKGPTGRYAGGSSPDYDVLEPGFKYNMMDIQAALGLCQMRKLERFNRRRAELAARYGALLREVPELAPLARADHPVKHAWHLYVVRLDLDAVTLDRSAFMRALAERKIGSGLHFLPLHLSHWYRKRYGHARGDLPQTEYNGERIFSLPLYPGLRDEDVDLVVWALRDVIDAHRRRP
jgi:UDP-4-amino-4-deoxy-L-arabinose-oxoglutarate aminotransferase